MSRFSVLVSVTVLLVGGRVVFAQAVYWMESGFDGICSADLGTSDREALNSESLTNPSGTVLDVSKPQDVFGDFDGDGDVDRHDYSTMQICLSFSGPEIPASPACNVFDADHDGDVDLQDFEAFMLAFTGPLSGVLVEAGSLVPILWTPGLYYSGEPGTWGNNALNGFAAQAGYTQDDLWYEWSVESLPDASGPVIISNSSLPATAYTILPPVGLGAYLFKLQVTNLITFEFGSDTVTLEVVSCLIDTDCDDGNLCTTDECIDAECVWAGVECPEGQVCDPVTGTCTGDADGDGVHDLVDNCPEDANPDQADADGDGIGNVCDNCPSNANADQADADSDGVGNLCDNCPNDANANQADADSDGVGNLCDNCPNDANANQADSDGDGIGDVCDTGGNGSDIQIQVDAGLDQDVTPCQEVTLSASASAAGLPDAQITISWSGDTGLVDDFVDALDGTATFTVPVPTDTPAATFNFTATATTTTSGYTAGTDEVVITRPEVTPTAQDVGKTSGAAQPGETVTLSFTEPVPPEFQDGWWATWTTAAGNPVEVTLTPVGDNREVTFTAPDVAETTELTFNALVVALDCNTPLVTDSVMVSIQVAYVVLDFSPAGNQITIGETFHLTQYTTVTGAPTELDVLYSVEDPPSGATIEIDQDVGTLTIISGGVGETVTVTVQVFGTAGLLAEAWDTIEIIES